MILWKQIACAEPGSDAARIAFLTLCKDDENGDAIAGRLDIYPDALHYRTSSKGLTPLMIAANYGAWGICELLLDRGADPACQSYRSKTAAYYAGKPIDASASDLRLEWVRRLALLEWRSDDALSSSSSAERPLSLPISSIEVPDTDQFIVDILNSVVNPTFKALVEGLLTVQTSCLKHERQFLAAQSSLLEIYQGHSRENATLWTDLCAASCMLDDVILNGDDDSFRSIALHLAKNVLLFAAAKLGSCRASRSFVYLDDIPRAHNCVSYVLGISETEMRAITTRSDIAALLKKQGYTQITDRVQIGDLVTIDIDQNTFYGHVGKVVDIQDNQVIVESQLGTSPYYSMTKDGQQTKHGGIVRCPLNALFFYGTDVGVWRLS